MIWLGLFLTERCSVRCPHCFLQGSNLEMPLPEALGYIDGMAEIAAQSGEALNVSLTGGEPFLRFPAILEATEHARRRGAARVSCVSNGSWGRPKAAARRMAREFSKAGGSAVFFSMDDFHQQQVPLESVRGALDACGEAGLSIGIKCTVGRGTHRAADVVASLGDLTLRNELVIQETPRLPTGSDSAVPMRDLLFRRGIPRARCPSAALLGIRPDGTSFMCSGAIATDRLIAGNARQQTIAELWSRIRSSPLLAALYDKGPAWFLPYFKTARVALPRDRFVSECDLCQVLLGQPGADRALGPALRDWRKERVTRIMKPVRGVGRKSDTRSAGSL